MGTVARGYKTVFYNKKQTMKFFFVGKADYNETWQLLLVTVMTTDNKDADQSKHWSLGNRYSEGQKFP